jgi:glycosyltransferase involved in cell wall biosynthesis
MWHGQRIGVVVPAFNESRLIASMLRTVPDYVDRIYVVDDGSTDDTATKTRTLESPRIVVVRHVQNRGVGAAIASGYARGVLEGMDVLAVMAGDGQMAPSDLELLLLALLDSDYAKGNRLAHPLRRRMPFERRVGSQFLSWLTRLTTGLEVQDCQCGYTAIRAEAARGLPLSDLWPRYGYPNDLLALLAAGGFSVTQAAVTPVYGLEASGLHPGHMLSISYRILMRFVSLRLLRTGSAQDGRRILPTPEEADGQASPHSPRTAR